MVFLPVLRSCLPKGTRVLTPLLLFLDLSFISFLSLSLLAHLSSDHAAWCPLEAFFFRSWGTPVASRHHTYVREILRLNRTEAPAGLLSSQAIEWLRRSAGEVVLGKGTRWHVRQQRKVDVGWVETWGEGVKTGRVNREECFLLRIFSSNGTALDQGCFQGAAFFTNMTANPSRNQLHINTMHGKIRLAARVEYQPNFSMHRVCYTAPNPGNYRLQVSLMFTNAFRVETQRDPSNAKNGYAGYLPVIKSDVRILASDEKFSLLLHRNRNLPPCNLSYLADSRTQGFWIGHIWLPYACRLRRVEPKALLKWLNGKSVLFLGDSEMRYAYGFLQFYLGLRRRLDFWPIWKRFRNHNPRALCSKLEEARIPSGMFLANHPMRALGSDVALKKTYWAGSGWSTFLGSRFSGFGWQHLKRNGRRGQGGVTATLTYISYFNRDKDLVSGWMLNRSLTNGETPLDSQPFDLVIEASLLHGVLRHDSVLDYRQTILSNFLPSLKAICPLDGCQFISFGPLTGWDELKASVYLHKSNNLRNRVFEEEQYETLREQGYRNILHMSSLTGAVRASEIAADPTHFRAPLQLAMIDLIFGSLCDTLTCGTNFI